MALIKSALDEHAYGWLKHSAAVDELERSALLELKTVIASFVSEAALDTPPESDEQTHMRWERRYHMGIERLQHSGIKTTDSGAAHYISLRTVWDRYIALLAPRFALEMDEVDTAMAKVK